MGPSIILDTNVVVSALRSKRGASHAVFRLIGTEQFILNLSVPVLIEYERALREPRIKVPYSDGEIAKILNYVCAHSKHRDIYFLWRPFLPDPGDDMILELAVASGADYIITFNKRDFRGIERFGLKVKSPFEFLEYLGEIPWAQ